MPAWVTLAIAVSTLLFGAGSSWAIQSYRQSNSEKVQSDVVKELRECVDRLQTLVTEVEVMKVANARFERQSLDQEKRLAAVEIAVAKLQPRRKR